MISYVKGPLAAVEEDVIVVEAGSLGMAIHVPLSVLEELPPLGEEVFIYTYFQVREDAMSLYGFLSKQDREMFCQLLGVNGVGPRAALGILSALRPDELRAAIVTGDAKAITRAPGIGNKTAQRVILDLKDKVDLHDALGAGAAGMSGGAGAAASYGGRGLGGAAGEAVEALTALGYSNQESSRAVGRVELTQDMTAEDVLKAALRHLTFL